MGSVNKLAVLLAVAATAEEEPISEPFLSLSGPCAEAASKSSLYVLRHLGTALRVLCALE